MSGTEVYALDMEDMKSHFDDVPPLHSLEFWAKLIPSPYY